MPSLTALITGTAFGLLLGLSAATPATATTPEGSIKGAVVQGETWSSPAYPVDCDSFDAQVMCTPNDPSASAAVQCFQNVLVGSARTTVCTTFEDHVSAIKAAGGRPLLVEYGCSLGDAVCLTFENAGRGLALSATQMMGAVAENMRFDTSSLLWSAAVEEWSFWQWAILLILLAAMVWAVTAAIVSGDRDQLVGALLRTFIAIPAVPLTLWVTGHLLNAIDDLTWYVLNRNGPGSLFAALQGVMWAGGQANYFFAFVIHGLLMIGMLLLMLVFTFRNIALAALITVGPIAWMIFPVRGIGPQWVVRYLSAVIVLLLTGPLTIGFVTLIVNGLSTVKTIWDPQSWPLLFGLVLVAFAPFAVFGLFSFVGAVAADGLGSGTASHAGRMGSGAARTAMRVPSRLGASPAGMLGSRGSAALAGGGSRGPAASGPRAVSGAAVRSSFRGGGLVNKTGNANATPAGSPTNFASPAPSVSVPQRSAGASSSPPVAGSNGRVS